MIINCDHGQKMAGGEKEKKETQKVATAGSPSKSTSPPRDFPTTTRVFWINKDQDTIYCLGTLKM